MDMETLNEQAASLSSGTIATLIDCNDVDTIDEVHRGFVKYCSQREEQHDGWQVAWAEYWTPK